MFCGTFVGWRANGASVSRIKLSLISCLVYILYMCTSVLFLLPCEKEMLKPGCPGFSDLTWKKDAVGREE